MHLPEKSTARRRKRRAEWRRACIMHFLIPVSEMKFKKIDLKNNNVET